MSEGGERLRARHYLLPTERLVAEVRWHPVSLIRPALVFLFSLVLITIVVRVIPAGSGAADAFGYIVVLPLGYFIWKLLDWWNERLVVSDRRLLMITGLLSRKVAVMPMRKVTDLTFQTPLIGRVFANWGWGTFIFESAGQDQAFHRVPYVPRPEVLYSQLSEEIFGEFGISGRKPRPNFATARASGELSVPRLDEAD
jgi:hypothetical protein